LIIQKITIFDVFLTLFCYKIHMSATIYSSYLLRLWLEPGDSGQWRAMLESPLGGERQGFASLEALFAFLEQETQRLQGETAPPHRNPTNDL